MTILVPIGTRLVVDTCICRSCGGTCASDDLSLKCSDILSLIYDSNYFFVCTPQIKKEIINDFDENVYSYFTHQWFRNMISRNKIFIPDQLSTNDPLRWMIESIPYGIVRLNEILKDVHLIEAANVTDDIIISRDSRAFSNFKELSFLCKDIQKVIWIDINDSSLDVLSWLKDGANYDSTKAFGMLTTISKEEITVVNR